MTATETAGAEKAAGAFWQIDASLPAVRRIKIADIEKVHATADDTFVKSIQASNGPMQPIILVSAGAGKYRIVEGKRRVFACRALELDTIDARVYDADKLSTKDRAIVTIRMNHHRSLNPVAEYAAINVLRKAGLTETADIAKAVGLNIRQIQRLTRLDKLADPLRAVLEAGRMTFDTALKAAALPAKDQRKLIKLAEEGGEDEAGRISADSVHALREVGPAHGLDKLFTTDVQANPDTLIVSALSMLERAGSLMQPDSAHVATLAHMRAELEGMITTTKKKGGK